MISKKGGFFKVFAILLAVAFAFTLGGCPSDDDGNGNGSTPTPTETPKPELVIADLSWDSAQLHARIAGFIIENGYEYPEVQYVYADTIPGFLGLTTGDIDISMEIWIENQQEAVDEALAAGTVLDLGDNYWDNWQGWLVPRYMVEGDIERGIEAVMPGVESVFDMAEHWELFQDPEEPSKGRFYSCIPGWECEIINEAKMQAYGLDQYYNVFLPGSGAALLASLESAYLQGEPWFGYYWDPTPPMGKFDMVQLSEPAYDPAIWDDTYACAYPAVHVNVFVNAELEDTAPEIVEFLTAYATTSAQNSAALAYMDENDATVEDAAIWFLNEYEDTWTSWVSTDVANKVKAAL
jgi:glycine betaine/proline transport system substrate-binding protein